MQFKQMIILPCQFRPTYIMIDMNKSFMRALQNSKIGCGPFYVENHLGRWLHSVTDIKTWISDCTRTQGAVSLYIKMPSYQFRDPHIKDKTVSWLSSSLTWESPYLGKTVFILKQHPGGKQCSSFFSVNLKNQQTGQSNFSKRSTSVGQNGINPIETYTVCRHVCIV